VALGALRHLAVDTVTEGAVKGSMFAHIVLELGNLRSVQVIQASVTCLQKKCLKAYVGFCDRPGIP